MCDTHSSVCTAVCSRSWVLPACRTCDSTFLRTSEGTESILVVGLSDPNLGQTWIQNSVRGFFRTVPGTVQLYEVETHLRIPEGPAEARLRLFRYSRGRRALQRTCVCRVCTSRSVKDVSHVETEEILYERGFHRYCSFTLTSPSSVCV